MSYFNSNFNNKESNIFSLNDFLNQITIINNNNNLNNFNNETINNSNYLNEIEKENNSLKTENKLLKNENDNLKKENNEMHFELEKIKKKFETDIEISKLTLNEKNKKINILLESNSNSNNIIKDLNDKILKYQNIFDNINNNGNNNFSNDEIIILQKEIEEKNIIIEQLKNEIQNLNNNNNNFNNEENDINKLKEMNEFLINKVQNFPNFEEKINELENEINLLKRENEILKNNNNNFSPNNQSNNSTNNINNIKKEKDIPINLKSIKKNNLFDNNNNNINSNDNLINTGEKKIFFKKIPSKNIPINNNYNNINNLLTDNNNNNNLQSIVISPSKQTEEINDTNTNNNISNNTLNNNTSNNITSNNTNNNINIKPFHLYSLHSSTKSLVDFNLLSKTFITMNKVENFDEYLNSNKNENNNLYYNTLEGLFILNENKELYYYSNIKNNITHILNFSFSHVKGNLFMQTNENNIFALGGGNKKVEKMYFESGTLENLPDLNYARENSTIFLINSKIFVLFGAIENNINIDNIIECYIEEEKIWKILNLDGNEKIKNLNNCGTVNLNDKEIIILGGCDNEGNFNDKFIYINLIKNNIIMLDKTIPKNIKNLNEFTFKKNSIFNIYIDDASNNMFYVNIDDNDIVHIIDTELNYDLFINN